MKKADSRIQHFSNVLSIGTGLAYAYAKYFSKPSDPYSNATSAWEPTFHNSHVVVVPLLVFACGVIWQNHILPMWRARAQQLQKPAKAWSGLALLFVLLPMIATGYLIQVSVDEFWRKAWVVVHLVTSGAWTLSYVVHWIGGRSTLSRASGRCCLGGERVQPEKAS